MDVLSDLLRSARLKGSIYWKGEFGKPFAISSDARPQIDLLLPTSRHHITIFHLVAAGQCWLHLVGHNRVQLRQGDAILLPHGDEHVFGNGDAAPISASDLIHAGLREGVMTSTRHGGSDEVTTIVCGYVLSGDLFFRPIFRDLPPLLIERTADAPLTSLLAATVRQLLDEVDALRPGGREMLGRTMETLFIEMLRSYIGRLPEGMGGWLGALADPTVARALQYIHAEPAHDWGVKELAILAGASRSGLAERFKTILGQPPMLYITNWRLQLATGMLRDGGRTLGEIAAEVGYKSEAAFSRAFKRHFRVPPGMWRQQNIAS
jgi:AraC-like DNA-binding protein